MSLLLPESTYESCADSIFHYLDLNGYRDIVSLAQEGHYFKYYAWYLASHLPDSPVFAHAGIPPDPMTLFYNAIYWYRVFLLVQEAIDGYSDGDASIFNELISSPPAPPDAAILTEVFELADGTAANYIERHHSH